MRQDFLVIEQPATRWEDALPSGNGHMGAMAYGAIHQERILLNHEALWLPLFRRPKLPNVGPYLPEYRRLLEIGKFEEANAFWERKLRENGWPDVIYTNPFMPACDLMLTQEIEGPFSDYRRQLDMATGEVSTRWHVDGVDYERRLFVSRADQVIVLKLSASRPGSIDLSAKLSPHPMFEENRKTWHYPRRYAPEEIPVRYRAGAEGNRLWLACEFTSPDGGGYGCAGKLFTKGDTFFETSVNVPFYCNPYSSNEGEMAAADGRIDVQHASEVVLLLKIDANRPSMDSRARLWKEIDAVGADYDKLMKAHTAIHREMYERVRLELNDTGAAAASNDALLSQAYKAPVSNALTERLYNYGRYLFISSTAPGGWPSNLQGVWNGDYIPAWSSDYTIDENVEMNHWLALPGNLPELTEPYFRYFESALEDWKENAKSFYGCRGAMAPLRQSDNGLMSENMPYLIWTAGAGWIAQLFFDYWLFTGDRNFLAEHAIPFLKEVALFYEDFLYPGPDGKMIVCPSMSPENIPDVPGGTRPSLNPTMDIAVCREVLMSLIAACETLGSDADAVARWKTLLEKLPTYQTNEDGALREWLYPGLKDNYHHRHLSHLYGLFPGREITPAVNPDLFRACEVAVEKRLVVGLKSQTSWSLAHMANLYARLHRGEKAIECFDLIARSCLGVNLFTYHNDWRGQGITIHDGKIAPFQIDANMGLTAAVQEMLLFSTPGRITILPAAPKRWKSGRVTGLKAHGDITVSIEWDRPARTAAVRLRSTREQTIHLALQPDMRISESAEIRLPANQEVTVAVNSGELK